MQKVTQAMIAAKLGVSRTAVAHGLGLYRGKTVSIPEKMRDRIVKAAQEMGYRPNRFAQTIAGRPTQTIGVMSFGGISQIAVQRAKAITQAIQSINYDSLLYEVAWYQKKGVSKVLNSLLDSQPEALILIEPTSWFDPSLLEEFFVRSTPMVSVGGIELENVPRVATDEYMGMRLLTRELIAKGVKDLLFLCSLYTRPEIQMMRAVVDRAKGFVDEITAQGGVIIHPSDKGRRSSVPHAGTGLLRGELVDATETVHWNNPYQPGYEAMKLVLDGCRERLPQAVLCLNDDWAFGALRLCGERGICVPQNLWMTGNDGTVISGYGETPLTTIHPPLDKIAATAIDLIQNMIKGNSVAETTNLKFEPALVWRRSTGC